MQTITITELRATISDLISRVAFGGDRLLVKRNDKVVAAIVPYEDFQLLEDLHDKADAAAMRAAASEESVPYEAPAAVEEARSVS